jgi:hypothetical protein
MADEMNSLTDLNLLALFRTSDEEIVHRVRQSLGYEMGASDRDIIKIVHAALPVKPL